VTGATVNRLCRRNAPIPAWNQTKNLMLWLGAPDPRMAKLRRAHPERWFWSPGGRGGTAADLEHHPLGGAGLDRPTAAGNAHQLLGAAFIFGRSAATGTMPFPRARAAEWHAADQKGRGGGGPVSDRRPLRISRIRRMECRVVPDMRNLRRPWRPGSGKVGRPTGCAGVNAAWLLHPAHGTQSRAPRRFGLDEKTVRESTSLTFELRAISRPAKFAAAQVALLGGLCGAAVELLAASLRAVKVIIEGSECLRGLPLTDGVHRARSGVKVFARYSPQLSSKTAHIRRLDDTTADSDRSGARWVAPKDTHRTRTEAHQDARQPSSRGRWANRLEHRPTWDVPMRKEKSCFHACRAGLPCGGGNFRHHDCRRSPALRGVVGPANTELT